MRYLIIHIWSQIVLDTNRVLDAEKQLVTHFVALACRAVLVVIFNFIKRASALIAEQLLTPFVGLTDFFVLNPHGQNKALTPCLPSCHNKKTMRKLITAVLLLCVVAIFAGCDAVVGLENVRRDFPNAEIVTIPGQRAFIARLPNGEIWYAYNDGMTTTGTTVKTKLMEGKQ